MKFTFLLLLLSFNSFAHEYLSTNTHSEVAKKINELEKLYPPEEILVVYDIDNTVLRAKQDLGSDQWFEWHTNLINLQTNQRFDSIDKLLEFQIKLFSLSKMIKTENIVSNLLASYENAGHPILFLTSRSPDMRNLTEKAFRDNNVQFPKTTLLKSIAEEWTTDTKKSLSYSKGIFMTSGMHKGDALKYLLNLSRQKIKAIIFVDDHERHVKRVFDTFKDQNDVEIITYRYGHEDVRVNLFKSSDKKFITDQEDRLIRLFNELF